MTGAAQREERVVAGGAQWVTVAFLLVGLLNYVYALLMTHFLPVGEYARFAAGQGLLLWATTVATVSVPWVLAQALARARSEPGRQAATRFAKAASAGSGLLAAAVMAGVGSRFTDPAAVITLAASAFIIFLGTTTTGWLQGRERMRTLSGLYVGENVLKNASGLLLVTVAGLGDAGALAGFGIGGLLVLAWWPRLPHGSARDWRTAVANRGLWRAAAGIAGLQGLVALFTAVDVVAVTLLPASRAHVASYQASAALSRVPVFIAGAVATAFFPALSRRVAAGPLATRAVRMYAMLALPVTAVLVTVPAPVLAAVFPAEYGSMAQLVRFTALGGLAVGGISLVTAFFQAADDYACWRWLAAGLVAFAGALLGGWLTGGITGLAAGAAAGTGAVLAALCYRLARRQGRAVFGRIPLITPAVALAVLAALRPWPGAGLAAAACVGLLVGARFLLRPPRSQVYPTAVGEERMRRAERGETMRITRDLPAAALLADTLWRERPRQAGPGELARALALARRNHVEGRLARAYPGQLPAVLAEVRVVGDLFTRNLGQVSARLRQAGIPAVLIKADAPEDCISDDFDLVIRGQQWDAAVAALTGWYVHLTRYWLERTTKALLFPPVGPALHLHTGVSWFGVPVLRADRLLARAQRRPDGCLGPAPPDELRIWLAHALFQDLMLTMSELFTVRGLLAPGVVGEARAEAAGEGWAAGFDGVLAIARAAIARLDAGQPLRMPVPVPAGLSLRTGAEHARHLLRRGQPRTAAREAALRVPLIIAKRRRLLLG